MKATAMLCLAVLLAGSACSTSGTRPCAGFGLPLADRSPDAASAITRVVLADGAGLVQFERADGTIFTRAD